MMTFGELNVFSTADARLLVSRCALWLELGGRLLTEVHTFEEVKRQGMAEASWQRCPDGLFLGVPHLLLTEHSWDEEEQTSSTQFWAIEANGHTTRFGSQMTAWRDEEYVSLLNNTGFTLLPPPAGHDWPVSETFEGKLFALLAEKAKTSGSFLLILNTIKGIQHWISHVFLPSVKANTVSTTRSPKRSTPHWAVCYA